MPTTIRLGSTGEDVIAWQRAIGVTADGVFGPATEAVTRAWQAQRGLVADGVVGSATWAAASLSPIGERNVEIIRGIDVSAIQGIVPWRACRQAGVRFAWMRGCVGNEPKVDGRFAENVRGAVAEGIVPGGYFFPFPLPHLDPVAQVAHACALMTVDDHVVGELVGELPLAFDLEWPPPEERAKDGSIVDVWKKWGCSPTQIVRWATAAIRALRARMGVWPAVYTYPYFFKRITTNIPTDVLAEFFEVLAKCPFWSADYRAVGRVPSADEKPFIPEPWASLADAIVAWQHDGNGGLVLPGSNVDCDWNVLLGGEEALARLIGTERDAPKELVVDLTAARQEAMGILIEESIAEYRRSRIAA